MDVTPLAQGFGALVSGIDLDAAVAPADIAALQRAYDGHDLLVFRGCGRIAPKRHAEIASWFGPIGTITGPGGTPWSFLNNADVVGRERLAFHCDMSFLQYPVEGISLHALELPDSPTSTSFVSNTLAWSTLPASLRDAIGERKVRHFFDDSVAMQMPWPTCEFWHPLRLAHPRTGKPVLFATQYHADQVEGLAGRASADLLERLFAHLYRPDRVYEHEWQVGDFLVWDNFAIQHARTEKCDRARGSRVLQRVAIGSHAYLEQMAAAG